jgi:MurNAc alpha-1-phosphate uridylyltransferase
MILAAGRGERLQPLTRHTPKPMLTVDGRPLLEHQLGWLRAAGIRQIVMNLHHLGEQIERHFGDGRRFGVEIRYSREPTLLETGGGIVNALPLLGDEPFLILNGDVFTDFAFAALAKLPGWADIHLVVTPRPPFRSRGDFEVRAGRVIARGDAYVYCGIAVLRPELFAADTVEPFSLRRHLFRAMEAGRLSAQIWNGYWTDIGTRDQLDAANARDSVPDAK